MRSRAALFLAEPSERGYMHDMWWRPSPMNRFRRDKFADYFRLLDRNHNGILDLRDFTIYADEVQKALDLPPDHPRLKHLLEATHDLWVALSASMDEAGDGTIRLDEMVGSLASLEYELRGGAAVPAWARRHVQAVFAVLDIDESGGIDADEYAIYLRAMGSDANAAAAFDRLGPDADGTLHLERVEALYREWVTAGSPEAAGNVLMTGRLPGHR